jgi:hypothetical protein
MLDGKIIRQNTKSVYMTRKPGSKKFTEYTKVYDFCAELEDGNHILELYGAESCCDGTVEWKFQVNDGKWELFTTKNLNKYRALQSIEGDTIVEYGDVKTDQKSRKVWHTVEIQGMFNSPVVIMGTPSFNGGHPLTIRVKDVTRSSFKWQMQEWSYLDGPHTTETISYMIVEEGQHTLYDGTLIEAGKT